MIKLIVENIYCEVDSGGDTEDHKPHHRQGRRHDRPVVKDDSHRKKFVPVLSKERLKIAGQLLKEKFDIAKHMVHIYQLADTQRRILRKLDMTFLGITKKGFAEAFISEVDEMMRLQQTDRGGGGPRRYLENELAVIGESRRTLQGNPEDSPHYSPMPIRTEDQPFNSERTGSDGDEGNRGGR